MNHEHPHTLAHLTCV